MPLLILWGLCITPLSIHLANRYQIVDHPGERKTHKGIIPRGAGIVIWLGFLIWCLFAAEAHPAVRYIGTGGAMVFLAGYRDDMKSLAPLVRLVIHVGAGLVFLLSVELPAVHLGVCLFWITGMTNAYNLIDGANGLCLLMFISACLLSSPLGNTTLFFALAGLAGGVLHWNFPSARTFLGDGGTTLLGYLFSCFFIYTVAPGLGAIRFVELPFFLLLAGGVPGADTLFAIMRRVWGGRSPFSPDRGHIHHILMDRGISPFWTVIILTVFQSIVVGSGVFLFIARLS
ncbi:MAG: undecaprenyl/decaprenyl-phosphate alpha-N-acetylglucosaminyl 1-phosphate transferase [Synergistaceae bacterium]|nr:undecaprenyl/decaprenyl-phosphate alpha-N-acetylglucosaminyl 1-phosphate transferase [Synergistaceae bacterium]